MQRDDRRALHRVLSPRAARQRTRALAALAAPRATPAALAARRVARAHARVAARVLAPRGAAAPPVEVG